MERADKGHKRGLHKGNTDVPGFLILYEISVAAGTTDMVLKLAIANKTAQSGKQTQQNTGRDSEMGEDRHIEEQMGGGEETNFTIKTIKCVARMFKIELECLHCNKTDRLVTYENTRYKGEVIKCTV